MNILVTGGAGYIGSVVVEELLRDGHEVTVYDNLSKGHREAITPRAEFVQADLREQECLKPAIRQRYVEAVIHMAADSLVGESGAHHQSIIRTICLP
jgi:UDP-glucose 4-epimerase